MENCKAHRRPQNLVLIELLFLVILGGITLNSCRFNTDASNNENSTTIEDTIKAEVMNLEKIVLIDKSCNSDFIFIQSEVNKFDTVTIYDFILSKSFFNKDEQLFSIIINDKLDVVKRIICGKASNFWWRVEWWSNYF